MVPLEFVIDPHTILAPVLLIIVYFCDIVFTIVTSVIYFQRESNTYSKTLVSWHLAFSIIGGLNLLFCSGVLWLWSSKYSMTHADRIWRLCIGQWCMFALKDAPLLVIEATALLQTGWKGGNLGDACFVVQVIFFVPSALASSAMFSWHLSGFLERQFGNALEVALQEKEIQPPLLVVTVPPPLPLTEMRENGLNYVAPCEEATDGAPYERSAAMEVTPHPSFGNPSYRWNDGYAFDIQPISNSGQSSAYPAVI